MKKLTIFFLTVMMAVLAFAAVAENIPEVKWADVEAAVAEEGYEGEFVEVPYVGMKIWIPTNYIDRAELEEEDEEAGMIVYLTENDDRMIMVMMLSAGMDADEYMAEIAPTLQGASVSRLRVNGHDAVDCIYADEGFENVLIFGENGRALQISYSPAADEELMTVAAYMTMSVQ